MRIQFISTYSQLYGANRSLLSLIEFFHHEGYSVNVLLPSNGTMATKLKEEGIPFQVIPYYAAFLYITPIFKHVLVPFLGFLNLFVFPIIVYKIKKFNPDLIYSNSSAENLGIFVSKILKKKHIAHIREFMFLDYNSSFIFGKKAKQKFINLSDGSIYVSKAVLMSIHGDKGKDSKYKVIYNGINITINDLPNKVLNKNEIIFGIVGILDPAKGQDIAIEYFKRLLYIYPEAKLHIYGDKAGNYKNKIIKLVSSLNLTKSVKFCGFVNNQDVIYKNIDILLMFSKSEGFGRVTIEAALNGIPVIGFDNAGTSELIKDKQTGCLFTDYTSFLEAVNYLVLDDNHFEDIRINSFKNAKDVYSIKTYCENVKEFIHNI